MKKTLIALGGVALLLGSSLNAAVTINVTGGTLYENDGTTPISNGIVTLLVDTAGDGFGDLTTAIDSFTAGSDDVVLGKGEITPDTGGFGAISINNINLDSLGLNPGASLLLVWYSGISLADSGPGAGTFFGTYRVDGDPQDGSTIGWNLPNNVGNKTLNFFTQAVGGSNPESAGRVQFQTQAVPEPSTYALLMLGGLALLGVRRFRKA